MVFKRSGLPYVVMIDIDYGLYEEIEQILDTISTPDHPLEIDELIVILLENFVAKTRNVRAAQYD